jgi:hypothetical protein
MPRASRINPQFEIAAKLFDLGRVERLEFIHVERRREFHLRHSRFFRCS